MAATRHNEGKPRWDLMPYAALDIVAAVYTQAVESGKYEEHNWRLGLSNGECISSTQRHISQYMQGNDINPDTELPHLAHAVANLLMLLEYPEPYKDTRPAKKEQYYYKEKKWKIKVKESNEKRFAVTIAPGMSTEYSVITSEKE